jgi:hypothetical protein
VLEQADWDIDLNQDGSFTPSERGSYIAPRINVITRYDLSKHATEWQSLPDTDNDGLNDYVEADLGTNPNQADSDNDGLSDAEEVNLGTNPLNRDTDGDGVADGADPIPDGIIITVQSSGGGTVSPGTLEVNRGTSTQFQLLANKGYKIAGTSGCNGSIIAAQFITAELQQSCTLQVTFKQKRKRSNMLLFLVNEINQP